MPRRVLSIYRDAFQGLPPSVWWLCLIAFIHRSGTMVLPFLSLYATEKLGLDVNDAGIILALFGFGSVFGSVAGGWLCDRIGPEKAQAYTMFGSGIGMIALAFVQTPIVFGVGIFVTSVVGEAFRPAVMSLVSHHSPDAVQGRSFGLLRLAVNLGMAVGPAIGGILSEINFKYLFFGNGLMCFVSTATFLAIAGSIQSSRLPMTTEAEEEPSGGPYKDRTFLLLIALVGIYACLLFQVFCTLPVYLRNDYGYDKTQIGFILAFNAFLIVVFEMILLRRLEMAQPMKIIAFGALATGVGFGILPMDKSLLIAVLSVMLWTFGEMLVLPFSNVLAVKCARPKQRGRYMGLYASTFSFAFIVAPFLGTRVYERFGADTLWYGMGGVGLVLAVICTAVNPAFAKLRPKAQTNP